MNRYDWPGNIRELRNCVESAVVMCSGSEITIDDLPQNIAMSTAEDEISIPYGTTLDEAERIIIEQNLAVNKNNKTKTAEILGIGGIHPVLALIIFLRAGGEEHQKGLLLLVPYGFRRPGAASAFRCNGHRPGLRPGNQIRG